VYTDYRPTPLKHYVFAEGGSGLHLVKEGESQFKQANFDKVLGARGERAPVRRAARARARAVRWSEGGAVGGRCAACARVSHRLGGRARCAAGLAAPRACGRVGVARAAAAASLPCVAARRPSLPPRSRSRTTEAAPSATDTRAPLALARPRPRPRSPRRAPRSALCVLRARLRQALADLLASAEAKTAANKAKVKAAQGKPVKPGGKEQDSAAQDIARIVKMGQVLSLFPMIVFALSKRDCESLALGMDRVDMTSGARERESGRARADARERGAQTSERASEPSERAERARTHADGQCDRARASAGGERADGRRRRRASAAGGVSRAHARTRARDSTRTRARATRTRHALTTYPPTRARARTRDRACGADTEKALIGEIFSNAIEPLSEDDKSLPQVAKLLPILTRGVGIHHGGLLPLIKEVVELLFQEGLIKARGKRTADRSERQPVAATRTRGAACDMWRGAAQGVCS
jgi:hypothetical protein